MDSMSEILAQKYPDKRGLIDEAMKNNQLMEMLNGKFRDTGRMANSPGEYLDSVVGVPVRTGINELQQGNLNWDALKKTLTSPGTDPKNAPTGVDLAWNSGIRNPYLGAAAATAFDVGAQIPVGGLSNAAGVAEHIPMSGIIKGVTEEGNVANAADLFKQRGQSGMSSDAKIAQLHGLNETPIDAMPGLLQRAKAEQEAPQQALENALYKRQFKPDFVDGAKVESYSHPSSDAMDTLKANVSEHGAKKIDELLARYGEFGRIEDALVKSHATNNPYTTAPINGFDTHQLPNYSTAPNGVIGEPGISISSGARASNPEQFPWMDDKYKAAKELLQKHQSLDMPAEIHTSSDLIAKPDYIDSIPDGSTVNMHMLTPDDNVNRLLFPGNPSQKRLEKAAQALEKAGVKVKRVYPTTDTLLDTMKREKINVEAQTGVQNQKEFFDELMSKPYEDGSRRLKSVPNGEDK